MRDKYHTQPRASTNSICQAALSYAERGFSVIPIEPRGKRPLIAWEQYQQRAATADEIKKLFGVNGANVAIVTGKISGIVVIDVDSEVAREKLKSIVPDYDLDAVPRSRTGRGWQLFFRHPGIPVPNRAGIFPGLDLRGDGGYVVAPPSVHPNGKIYSWEVPLMDELPKLPPEFFKLITESPEQTYRTHFNTTEALSGIEQGRRDETIFKLACKLRNADVPQGIADELILKAARSCDLPFPEKIALEKVARAYRKFPLQRPGSAGRQVRESVVNLGWVKLPRAVRDSALWREPRRFSKFEAWLDLVLSVNHAPTSMISLGLQTVELARGQMVTSQVKLAQRWGWDRKTVRRFLHRLKRARMLDFTTAKQRDMGWTLITLKNYDEIEIFGELTSPSESPSNSPSSAHQVPTNKKNKKLHVEREEGERVLGEGGTGTESKNTGKTIAESKEMLFPEIREQNGNSKEQNPKAGGTGHESEKSGKSPADATEIRVPENQDTNGTRTDTNPKKGVSGHASEEWDEFERFGEIPEKAEERLVQTARERMKATGDGQETRIDPFDLAADLDELGILQTKSQEELRAIAMIKNEFGRDARVVEASPGGVFSTERA